MKERIIIEKARIKYIDIAKCIGIILVVLGHTEFIGKNFIYQFHLPLFFFLSGFVFSEKLLEKPMEFLKKRIKSLYINFILFEAVFLLFHNFFVDIGFYNELSNVTLKYSFNTYITNFLKLMTLGFGEQLAGPLWFLISLLEINIIFFIILKFLKKVKLDRIQYCLAILIPLFFIGCYTDLPRMLSRSLIGLLFYGLGFFYKKYEEKIKFNIYYFIFSLLVVGICSGINFVDISKLMITYKTLLIISGICGTYSVIYISKKLNILNNKFILYCGQNTMYVLALHCIVFKLVMIIEIFIYGENYTYLGLFPVYQYNYVWSLIFTVFGTIVPLIIKRIIDFTKFRINNLKNIVITNKSN